MGNIKDLQKYQEEEIKYIGIGNKNCLYIKWRENTQQTTSLISLWIFSWTPIVTADCTAGGQSMDILHLLASYVLMQLLYTLTALNTWIN